MTSIRISPDPITKITQMGDVTLYEPAGDQPLAEQATVPTGRYQSRSLAECISNVSTPTGKKPILKTMLTTACERNCYYCPFRAGRAKTQRMTITPDDLAKAFMALHQGGAVDGLFLSSGIIKGSIPTQDKLIDAAEIIRKLCPASRTINCTARCSWRIASRSIWKRPRRNGLMRSHPKSTLTRNCFRCCGKPTRFAAHTRMNGWRAR
jgi:hypothetical protein